MRATNANGTTRSIDRTFMTHAVADVQAQPATNITRTSATLNGSFTGNGEPTTYHFEWGTTTSYGNSTPESSPSSAAGAVPASAGLSELASTARTRRRITSGSWPQTAPAPRTGRT